MSQQFRSTSNNVPLPRNTNRFPINSRETMSGPIYSQQHVPYAVQTQQPFGAPRSFPPQQIQPGPANIQLMQANYQPMYYPVQPMPMHPYSNPMQRLPDPNRTIQDHRKFEKERNFQLQQQRLKQFTIAGKKGSLNAENLLDSMFGKSDKNSKKASSKKSPKPDNKLKVVASSFASTNVAYEVKERAVLQKDSENLKSPTQDPKVLDTMMLQCSNLSAPQKPKTFQKPSVKQMPRVSSQGKTFSASEKAVDWRKIEGLDNIFTAPMPRFPAWCRKELVPPLYREVEKIVTKNGSHEPVTNLLLPILVSSGLPQKNLGEIWEFTNQASTGCLTCEEMYAALALIAIAQAGHQVKSIDILHQLPTCPIPILQCFSPTTETKLNEDKVEDSNVVNNMETSQLNAKRPTSLPTDISSFKTPSTDDEFDEFKSATPMAINAPSMVSLSSSNADFENDDFHDFQQAVPDLGSVPTNLSQEHAKGTINVPIAANEDLLSNEEDKYSVFRMLQNDEFGTFSTVQERRPISQSLGADNENFMNDSAKSTIDRFEEKVKNLNITNSENNEEFGDFLDANVVSSSQNISNLSNTQQQPAFAANFADFSKLDNEISVESHTQVLDTVQEDFDFGEFASCRPPQELEHDNMPSNFLNASAECQSISSLDFGTFDSLSHNGDALTTLSRQGSIPSLDLKSGCSEIDAGFGELQNSLGRSCTSPSPSVGTNKSLEEKSSFSFAPLSSNPPPFSVSLTDKYSVIRSEQLCNGDQHANEWTKCLQGCLSLLQNATRIFNQMSCSSVCHEVINAEEGKNYIKSVVEVYRVVCRVALASKSYEKQTDEMKKLLDNAEQAFHTLAIFLSGSPLLPNDASFDFSLGLLKQSENDDRACGICLLNVDSRSKAFCKNEDINKLSYGGRQYHSTCANLWVNCVDPLLPVLTLPQLI